MAWMWPFRSSLHRFLFLIKELNMNKKLLCAALLGGLGVAQAAAAQDFDDRWYLSGDIGYNYTDNSREAENAMFGAIGLGKFINPKWSLEGQLNWQKPKMNDNEDLNWGMYGVSLDLRRHFIDEGRNLNPYLLMGIGYQESEQEFNNFPNPDSPDTRKD